MGFEDAVDLLVGLGNLLLTLGSGQNNFTRSENEEDDFGFLQSEDEAGERLRVVVARVLLGLTRGFTVSLVEQFLKPNPESSVD